MIIREIHTFYEPIEGDSPEIVAQREDCDKVLKMWADSWYAHGWNPIVLGVADAKKHPMYQQVMDKVHSMPTAHEPIYNDRCYQRWLALAYVGGWYADPDMINYNFPPPDLRGQSITLHQGCACPSVIRMSSEQYNNSFIHSILKYEWEKFHEYVFVNSDGQHVVNDMLLLHNSRVYRHFDMAFQIMGEYGKRSFHGVDAPDEQHASIVHYTGPYACLNTGQRKSKIIRSVNRIWPHRWI